MRRVLALFAAFWIVVTPALADAQDQFFDSNGVRIRYVEQGAQCGIPCSCPRSESSWRQIAQS